MFIWWDARDICIFSGDLSLDYIFFLIDDVGVLSLDSTADVQLSRCLGKQQNDDLHMQNY